MIDPVFFEEKIADLKSSLIKRNADLSSLNKIIELSHERKETIRAVEKLKSERNQMSKEVGALKAKKASDAQTVPLIERTRKMGDEITSLDQKLSQIEREREALLLQIPNIQDASVPVGTEASANQEVRRIGTPRKILKPLDHVALGERLGILDFDRAGKLSGARFSVSLGAGAMLERALIQFMLDTHTRKHRYIEVIPPFLVDRKTMTGTGQLPKFETDLFKTSVGERELFLIPTAEVPLTNLVSDEILAVQELPLRLTAYSPCFRSEAGSYGKDTRGLIRQHQFQKVELVQIATPEQSMAQLEEMTSHAEKILTSLGLPYRVMLLCSGDMGFASIKTYDLEVWLPGQNAYREISSCSNCGDFQARRAKIRYRKGADSKPELVHTLNGSGLAVGRTLIAILENFQNEAGEIEIPGVLHPYIGNAAGFERRGESLWLIAPQEQWLRRDG